MERKRTLLYLNMKTLTWDKPFYYLDEKLFAPKIYDGTPHEDLLLSDFNTITLRIDGRMSSELNWDNAIKLAEHYVERGFFLFWEMECGLFNGLNFPLSDQMQFASLGLALDHFLDKIWKRFSHQIVGICLYRGNADFSIGFAWDETQKTGFKEWQEKGNRDEKFYCRDVCIAYLDALIVNLPDALQPFLLLDASTIDNLGQCAQLLTKERFERWHLGIKGSSLPFQEMKWEEGASPYGTISYEPLIIPPVEEIKTAVCLPSVETNPYTNELHHILQQLEKKKTPFKMIPEAFLITEWDGLDELIVIKDSLSVQGKRKVQGFMAAGGNVLDG